MEPVRAALVDPQLIEILEELLRSAKSGEIVGICYVGVKGSLHTSSGYYGLKDSRMNTLAMGELHVVLTELANIEGEAYS